MSKKDYQLLAHAIYAARQECPEFSQSFDGRPSAAEFLTQELSALLRANNARFDRTRFLEACETGRCKGMRPAEVSR